VLRTSKTGMDECPADRPTAVAVVHLRTVAREAMALLIGNQRGLQVAGVCSSVDQVLERPPRGPFVLLYDWETSRHDGPAKMMRIHSDLPGAMVLMYNVPSEDGAIVGCARSGAGTCVLDDVSVEGLVVAIRSLAEGSPLASPRVITSLFNHIANHQGADERRSAGLTRREEEILELMAQGYTNKEIANQLFLQHQTIKNHVRAIFHKLEVHSRLEVVRADWLANRNPGSPSPLRGGS
jgi:DNA-binding NarL/FixJ family response regulator